MNGITDNQKISPRISQRISSINTDNTQPFSVPPNSNKTEVSDILEEDDTSTRESSGVYERKSRRISSINIEK